MGTSTQPSDPSSLLNLQHKYVHDEIKRVQKQGGLYALVIDDDTERVLNRVITKEQLLRIVTSIEKIHEQRKQNLYMEAIYFCHQLVANLKIIAADAHANRYKGGIGLFIASQEPEVLHFFNGPSFLKNQVIGNYFNGNINYTTPVIHPVESRVFLTDKLTANSMPIYYNENCGDMVIPQIKKAAAALVNLMVLTEEMPLIRFYCPDQAMLLNQFPALRLSEILADEYQRQIDDYFRNNPDFPPSSQGDKPRSVLLIVDRSIDLYSPLLHEFTYQAMAMDIVPLLEREGIYKYQLETETGEMKDNKARLDNEKDEDWVNLRHLHIIESLELVINRINDLIKNNLRLVDRSNATTLSDLIYIMANLKGFDEERKLLTLHKTLIDECLDLNALRKLAEFAADFEQTCAAEGNSFEGEHNKHLHDDLIVLLAREDLSVNDKMRLVVIYGLYRGGLIELDFIKLVKFIGVNDRHVTSLISRCFTNLYKVGFPIVKKSVSDPKVDKRMFHTITNEGTFNTSRFGPGIKNVVQKAVKHQLDEDWFPYFREKPLEDDNLTLAAGSGPPTSLRNNRIKASWAQLSTRVGTNSLRPKQRVFVYVAGGMTHSEMRLMYELADELNKEVYIGSELILKPRDFLIGLQSIDKVKTPDDLDLELYKKQFKTTEVPEYLMPKLPRLPTQGQFGNGAPYGAAPHGQGQFGGNLPGQGQFGGNSQRQGQLGGVIPQGQGQFGGHLSQGQPRLLTSTALKSATPPQLGLPIGLHLPQTATNGIGYLQQPVASSATGYRPPEPVMPALPVQEKKKKSKLKKFLKKSKD